MTVCVRFFASLRDAVGTDELTVDCDESIGIDGLLAQLKEQLSIPAYEALSAESVRLAVNQELVTGPVAIESGDEVAFLPPVTSG